MKTVSTLARLETKIENIIEKLAKVPDLKTEVDKLQTKVKHNKYVSYTAFMLFIGLLGKLILGV
jgi:hypothetical protein